MRTLINGLYLTAALAFTTIGTANAANYHIDTDAQTGITYVGMAPTNQGIYFSNWDGFFGKKGDHNPGSVHITENANVYFVFDLSFLATAGIDLKNLTNARLELSAGRSYTPTEDFHLSLYDVSTNISELTAVQKDRADIFEDLQSGAVFGSIKLPYDFEPQTNYDISLNQDGLNALKSSSGIFAVGGSFNQWLQMDLDTAYLHPEDGEWGLYLQFATPVPEADTFSMFLAGLGLFAAMARRRKS